jgi:hypothetical protein
MAAFLNRTRDVMHCYDCTPGCCWFICGKYYAVDAVATVPTSACLITRRIKSWKPKVFARLNSLNALFNTCELEFYRVIKLLKDGVVFPAIIIRCADYKLYRTLNVYFRSTNGQRE